LKQLERQKKKEELELRHTEREEKRKHKSGSGVKKAFMTRSKAQGSKAQSGYGPQMYSESTSNECTICFGEYQDDLSSEGVTVKNWVQCTNKKCLKCMHEDCVCKNSEDNLVCVWKCF